MKGPGLRYLALAACCFVGACKPKPSPSSSYSGTIVIGSDYVQALVTAPGDRACPPRVQRIDECVKTPPTQSAACLKEPPCVKRLELRAGARQLASSSSSYVSVASMPDELTITIDGCGGRLEQTVKLHDAKPFSSATAKVDRTIDLSWGPTTANQVCALWRWQGGTEVCCAEDTGSASFPKPDGKTPTDVRLSRGVLLDSTLNKQVQLNIYRTAETANLLR